MCLCQQWEELRGTGRPAHLMPKWPSWGSRIPRSWLCAVGIFLDGVYSHLVSLNTILTCCAVYMAKSKPLTVQKYITPFWLPMQSTALCESCYGRTNSISARSNTKPPKYAELHRFHFPPSPCYKGLQHLLPYFWDHTKFISHSQT